MHSIRFKVKHYLSGPDCFDELTADQLLYFTKLYCKKIPRNELLKRISYRFTTDADKVYLKIPLLERIQIQKLYSWIYTEFQCTRNIIPTISHGGQTYYGYSDKLENVLVEEWMVADPAIRRYQETRQESNLTTAIAALYRPRRTDGIDYGDLREPFNEYKCRSREAIVAEMPGYIRLAILLNYMGLRTSMAKLFPHIFKKGSAGVDFGIPGMVHDMSGPELGTVKEIEKLWTIRNLLFLANKNEIRRLEMKQKSKAA